MKFPNYKNKKVLIFGLGLLGRGLKDTIFFAKKGAQVTVTDLKSEKNLADSLIHLKEFDNIKYTLGKHEEKDFLEADLIIRNAGVPLNSPFLNLALENKIPVKMDESMFAKYCPCPIIGITGTRGKTTTATLIYEIIKKEFEESDKNVYLSGNIQGEAALPLIDKITENDLVVLELSSWQLQGFGWEKISPHIAVFTNIYQDHLNYYKTMSDYIADKKHIFLHQKKQDFCVINKHDRRISRFKKDIPSQLVEFSPRDLPEDWQIKLPGEHNRENAVAAWRVAELLGIKQETVKQVLAKFGGVPHRLELIKTINNIDFINDTTSTTPVATEKALSAVKGPIVLLAGGAYKKVPLKPLAEAIAKNRQVKAVVLLEGTATDELEEELTKTKVSNLIAGRFDDFKTAIEHAYSLSLPGDTVLLSPGCASFGMFINEFDRGEKFKKFVTQLK